MFTFSCTSPHLSDFRPKMLFVTLSSISQPLAAPVPKVETQP